MTLLCFQGTTVQLPAGEEGPRPQEAPPPTLVRAPKLPGFHQHSPPFICLIPANQYEDQLQRDCCLDGMRDTPLSYDCEQRSEYIGDDPACVEAFLLCCADAEERRTKEEDDSIRADLAEEDNTLLDSDEIVTRTQFPASWLWMDVELPGCPVTQPMW